MPISADGVQLSIVEMTGVPPVLPATPTWTPLRVTGEGVAFEAETVQSAELSPDLGIKDSILVGATSEGEVNFELSDSVGIQTMLSACLGEDWTADVIHDSTDLKYYVLEKIFPGIPVPGQDSYHRFSNSIFTTFTLTATPGEVVSGAANISGGELTLDTAIVPGSTYDPAGDDPVLTPHDVVVSLGGLAATSCFGSITLTFDNQARGIQCLGTLGETEKVRGRMNATISGSLYYATDDILEALISQSTFAVSVEFRNNIGTAEYIFDFPKCKMVTAPVTASATDTDVTIDFEAQALFNESLGYTVEITRESAPVPIGIAITTAGGDTVTPAVVTLTGSFWPTGTTVNVDLDVDTATGQSFSYVLPIDASSATVATDLAAYITANGTDVTASGVGDTVELLASGAGATITVTLATTV